MIKWVRPCKRIRLSRLCTGGAAILRRLAGGFAEPCFVGHGFQFVLACCWLKVSSESPCISCLKWTCYLSIAPAGSAFCSVRVAITVAVSPADSADSYRHKTLFVSSGVGSPETLRVSMAPQEIFQVTVENYFLSQGTRSVKGDCGASSSTNHWALLKNSAMGETWR